MEKGTKENLKYVFTLLNSEYLNNWYGKNTKMKGNIREFYFTPLSKVPIRKIDFNNPRSVVNSVMIGTLLKMVIFAGAALAYATQKKAPIGMPTLLSSMGLYLIYTWLEIRWTQTKK